MLDERLRLLLAKVASGETHADTALEELRKLPFQDLGFAKVDQHRQLRQGLPEVIFCPGKTADQVREIAMKLLEQNDLVIATRASKELAESVLQPDLAAEPKDRNRTGRYFDDARAIVWGTLPQTKTHLGKVVVVTAGTSDLPVAREAEIVLEAAGIDVSVIADVGVAGLHRVISALPKLQEADVCIVIAGMDGVLSSVVGGLVACPVIACPSSIGYGAAFEGLAALLTMLNSCAAGITVVNIDNGFGAAIAAYRILHSKARQE